MKKITVLIEGGMKDLYLSENITTNKNSEMIVKSAVVYWDYNNVIKGVNDTFTHGGNLLTVPEGYWTPDMITGIRDRFILRVGSGSSQYYDTIAQLYLERNGSGGFSAYSSNITYVINLGSFGTLLGFDKNTTLPARTRKLSQNPADLNRGLKYITVSCNLVNNTLNFDTNGKRSSVITTLYVPPSINMKTEITYFNNINSRIPLKNGCFNNLNFNVGTNLDDKSITIGSVLLELEINDNER